MNSLSENQTARAVIVTAGVQLFLFLVSAGINPVWAQGNIYGTVQNSAGGAPAALELRWWGFLDDTDEEIRTETNTGAGYDGVNWFDDFQNYTTEGAGNPYDYYFANLANGETFHLAGPIPDNSFQQENVTLAAASSLAPPTGLTSEFLTPTEVRLSWHGVAGLTYHIYRRVFDNNGLFYRLDDPSGSLADPGVADSTFIDQTVEESVAYTYLIIGENAAGEYSPHSAEVTTRTVCDCGVPGDFDCSGGRDPMDVAYLINFVYKSQPFPDFEDCDRPDCPFPKGDLNCNGTTDPLDVTILIGHVYKGWGPACDCCNPSSCSY